ncbi:MAG TPA: aminotransferase class V-fold PLP-dependent enzyme [Tepidisphaeraceae bacterium]|nr:aminotransferase class V-fold PLP-dependent enzyme [Tepidisphaeraceae bacterium]
MTIDDLIGNEQAFPILKHRTFLNHAAVAPITAPAAEALRRYADQAQTDVYIGTGWYRGVEACRSTVARLINATSDEVALVKNTGEGISIVARGLDWQAGDRIITTAVEYPANIYPWMDLQQTHGVELVMIPETHQPDGSVLVSDDAIIAAIDHPRTRMVALSHVQYASGQRMDVARIGRRCRERGVLFCVDAIQSIGVLPVDVQSMSIDFLSADGHKWMLGPEGAGVFYIRKALLERVRPLSVGWMNVINAQDYGNYDFTLRPDARRYECGSWNIPGFLALGASLELLASVGIDVIFDRVRRLGDRLIAGLRRRGWRVISPRSEIATSAAVAFDSTRFAMQQVYESLRAQRIEVALREGRLRASPHFYNTDEQIDRLIDALPAH